MTNIAIIGYGYWGKNLLKTFDSIPDTSVKYICDKRKLPTFQGITHTDQLEEVLSDKSINAVVISTPSDTHFQIAKRCLLSGKNVFVEKPMALTVKRCEILVEMAKLKKLVLMAGHTFLYNDSIRKIKQYLALGDLGQIYSIKCVRNHLGLIREDVSVLWDLLPHDISICNYLLGELPGSVNATGSKIVSMEKDRDDIVFCTLKYRNGIIINMEASWLDTNKERTIKIVGSKAKIVFDDLDLLEPIRIFKKGLAVNTDGIHQQRDGDIVSPQFKRTEPLMNECKEFIDCIKHEFHPLSDGKSGLNVVRVLSSLQKSLDNNGMNIRINP